MTQPDANAGPAPAARTAGRSWVSRPLLASVLAAALLAVMPGGVIAGGAAETAPAVEAVPELDAPEPDAQGAPAPPAEEDVEEPRGSPGCPFERNELELLA